MALFETARVTVRQNSPITGKILGEHLPVQMDARVQDWQMQANALVPVRVYDCQSLGWLAPALQEGYYLIDEVSGATYSVSSDVFTATNSQQFTATKHVGALP